MKTRFLKHAFLLAMVSLCAVAITPLGAASFAAGVSPEQAAAFQSTLETAVNSRELLARKSVCFTQYLTAQQDLSADYEREMGLAMSRQAELEAQLVQSMATVKGQEELVASEAQNVQMRAGNVERARRERDEQRDRVNTCSAVLFFLPGICQAGDAAVKGFGWMNDAQRDYDNAQTRLRSAEMGLAEMNSKLAHEREQYTQAQSDYAKNKSIVERLEQQITEIKAAISVFQNQIHEFSIRLSSFQSAVDDAAETTLDDVNLRQFVRLSGELEKLSGDTPDFITQTQSRLPEDSQQVCGA